jgi:hypothetical protein
MKNGYTSFNYDYRSPRLASLATEVFSEAFNLLLTVAEASVYFALWFTGILGARQNSSIIKKISIPVLNAGG